METECVELEDGEVIDDNDDEPLETYNILQRPHTHTAATRQEPVKIMYSDESDESEAADSESDSDSGVTRVKRPKLKIKRSMNAQRHSKLNSDKYKVWCTQVQEESLTQELGSCGVTKKMFNDRSVESYDVPFSYSRPEQNFSDSESLQYENTNRTSNKRTFSDRGNVKLRLGKRNANQNNDYNPDGDVKILPDLSATVESTDQEVARDIAEKLSEKKDSLIDRVVNILGKEKAMDFFLKTKEIEHNGGMLIMNGSRRRTPGGIYLFLVKNDEHLPQEKIREIFSEDSKESTKRKKKYEAQKRNNTQELLRLAFGKGSDKDLPALLTRAELSTRQIAEEARLRRGEGIRDRVPLDSDQTVSNPPPSPVTDDPDHSEHPLSDRQIQNYADDFLDISEEHIDCML